ncbi:MAG: hypothetical protein ACLU0O_05245 [Collinsella sp.]
MQTYESDANIGNIKILAVDMDKTLLTDERVLPRVLMSAWTSSPTPASYSAPPADVPPPSSRRCSRASRTASPFVPTTELRDLSRQLYL